MDFAAEAAFWIAKEFKVVGLFFRLVVDTRMDCSNSACAFQQVHVRQLLPASHCYQWGHRLIRSLLKEKPTNAMEKISCPKRLLVNGDADETVARISENWSGSASSDLLVTESLIR